MQETLVPFLGREDPLEKGRLPTPVFWPGEFYRLYSAWGHRVTFLGLMSVGNYNSKIYTHPQRRQWQPTPVLLPGKSHGWRSLVGCSPWGHKESNTTERLHFHLSLSCRSKHILISWLQSPSSVILEPKKSLQMAFPATWLVGF